MTRDDYIKLHRQTVEAIELVEKHGEENCIVEHSGNGDRWSETDNPVWSAYFYRARLKPTKKLVPWSSLNEVPLTHWFRLKNSPYRLFRVASIDVNNAEIPLMIGDDIVSMGRLCDLYKHAAPCDKHSDLIWLPCGNEVVE